jgi:chaperone BCS1
MFTQISTWFSQALTGNQFFSGGLAVGVVAGLIAWLRNLPRQILNFLLDRFSTEVIVSQYDGGAFGYYESWLSKHTPIHGPRRWRASHYYTVNPLGQSVDRDGAWQFTPGEGVYWYYESGLLFRSHWNESTTSFTGNQLTRASAPYYRIRFLTTDRKRIETFLRLVWMDAMHKPQFFHYHTAFQHTGWEGIVATRRPLSSVLLPESDARLLAEDARTFLEREAWYAERGLSHARGYLFYGPPGNGKSSFIRALGSELGLNVAYLSLQDKELTSEKLRTLSRNLPSSTILVIEDIDRGLDLIQSPEKGGPERVPLGAVLSMLDGPAAGTRITILTANDISGFEPALFRPGRVDVVHHFGNATDRQAYELYLRFFPGDKAGAATFSMRATGNVSMAALQANLLKRLAQAEKQTLPGEEAPCLPTSLNSSRETCLSTV